MPDCPLLTLTLNPSLDVSYAVDQLLEDRKLHASGYRLDPGGNGINVARALKRLRRPAHACFAAGGEIGDLLERLLRTEVDHPHRFRIDGQTRINATIHQRRPSSQYELIGPGPGISTAELALLGAELAEHAAGGCVALTGSLPPGLPDDSYAGLMRRLRQRQARVALDMSGAALRHAVVERPWLIKPNRVELEELVGQPLADDLSLLRAATALVRQGVGHVCVSLGAEGALLVTASGAWRGLAPPVAVQSTVGAGDSMLAGLLAALLDGAAPDAALKLGLACGSGSAAQPGTELFDPSQLERLQQQARVSRIDAAV